MRKFCLSFLLLCLLAGCTGHRTGDLLFISAPADAAQMEGAIVSATGEIIHVAILEKAPDGNVWVIDATPERGVDRRLLDTLKADFPKADGYVYHYVRLGGPSESYWERAKTFLGLPYDQTFLSGNNALYCSELVWESYLNSDGSHLFDAQPMNFRASDGSFPQWWADHFARLGTPIPQDSLGTNPQDMYTQARQLSRKR